MNYKKYLAIKNCNNYRWTLLSEYFTILLCLFLLFASCILCGGCCWNLILRLVTSIGCGCRCSCCRLLIYTNIRLYSAWSYCWLHNNLLYWLYFFDWGYFCLNGSFYLLNSLFYSFFGRLFNFINLFLLFIDKLIGINFKHNLNLSINLL